MKESKIKQIKSKVLSLIKLTAEQLLANVLEDVPLRNNPGYKQTHIDSNNFQVLKHLVAYPGYKPFRG